MLILKNLRGGGGGEAGGGLSREIPELITSVSLTLQE